MLQPHSDEFDMKFVPELAGHADEGEELEGSESEEEYDDSEEEEYDESDEEEYDEEEEDELQDDEEDASEEEEEDSEEEMIPVSRYKNLQKFATQKAMELSEIRKAMLTAGTTKPAEQQQAKPADTNPLKQPLDELIDRKVNEKLGTLMEPLRAKEEEVAIQTAILALAESDEDFKSIAPLLQRELEKNPSLFEMEGGIELAYRAAKADFLGMVADARARAEAKAAIKQRQMKENATTRSSYTRQSQSKEKSEADLIKESIMGLSSVRPFSK